MSPRLFPALPRSRIARALPRGLALVLAVLAAGAAGAAAQPQNGIVRPSYEQASPGASLGRELFEANCASCHGSNGEGISRPRPGAGDLAGAGPSLHGVGAEAADFYLRTGFMPLSNIDEQPATHRVLFSEKELRSLVEFVAALGGGAAIPHPDPAAGSLSAGFELFTEDCAGCHQSLARGGFVTGARVPPLQGIAATQIDEAVRIGPYLMPRFSERRLSDEQLNAIVRYVLSTNRPDNRGGWSIGNLGPIPEGLIAWLTAIALAVICVGLARRLRA
jgi:ubiquinol-cytochrome c reductase cytochrome c subunit